MEKLAENDLTYVYHRHVVIVVTAVTTISLPPVVYATTDNHLQVIFNDKYVSSCIFSWKQYIYITFIHFRATTKYTEPISSFKI
jgi:hypothetical protein